MIVEQTGELLSLIHAQLLLSGSLWNKTSFLTIIPPLLMGLLLLLLADYGRMLYLHFNMVRPYLKTLDLRPMPWLKRFPNYSTATRPISPSPGRKYTSTTRRKTMDLLRETSKAIQHPHDNILDGTKTNNLDL
jgi:hypothetical protein